MGDLTAIAALAAELVALIGAITPIFIAVRKVSEGQRCLLRAEMLRIYYQHRESKIVRQYEYENFVLLYEAYKALKGNSFIDKIHDEVKDWEIVT